MIAADLNSRSKLLSLILKAVWIRRQRPSFAAESGLIVCQVQAGDSYDASFRVRGVFAEVLEPESAATGAECAGYRDSGLRFVAGRRMPTIVFQSLQIIRGEFDYQLRARSLISRSRTEIFESFESYAEARASAISWVRGCLFETGDLQPGEPESEAQPFSLSLSPARAKKALRWMPEEDRRALIGDAEPQDDAQAVSGREPGAGGQQAQSTPTFFEVEK